MNDFLDIYTVVFLVLAVFVIFRLRAVLGQRTGNERPPFNPLQRPEPPKPDGESNVVPLPNMAGRTPPVNVAPPAPDAAELIKGIAEPGTPLAEGLTRLIEAGQGFEPKGFLMGARAAYEMIVLAFAKGDRRALKDLLSKDVYENFVGAISAREARGEKVETTFVSIDKSSIIEAAIKDKSMQVSVRFASKLITATKDSTGAVIDGNPEKIADLADVWTFAQELGTRDPNWRVISTDTSH